VSVILDVMSACLNEGLRNPEMLIVTAQIRQVGSMVRTYTAIPIVY
jgi:hypothetical protein